MAIWIVQSVNREIRLLDYIEGAGRPATLSRSVRIVPNSKLR
jgi:hypothetical protein